MDFGDFQDRVKRSKKRSTGHLHSEAHILADEISGKLHDPNHFGMYLKMATTKDHGVLRRILGEVLENNNTKTPAKLFVYLVTKHYKK